MVNDGDLFYLDFQYMYVYSQKTIFKVKRLQNGTRVRIGENIETGSESFTVFLLNKSI